MKAGFKYWEFINGYPNQGEPDYWSVVNAIEQQHGVLWGSLSKDRNFFLNMKVILLSHINLDIC